MTGFCFSLNSSKSCSADVLFFYIFQKSLVEPGEQVWTHLFEPKVNVDEKSGEKCAETFHHFCFFKKKKKSFSLHSPVKLKSCMKQFLVFEVLLMCFFLGFIYRTV